MLTINYTKQFQKDYKKIKHGIYGKKINQMLEEVVTMLTHMKPFPKRFCDHELTGEWSEHRDCHLKPDLILIYRQRDEDTVEFVRLGSHSELGL